MVKTFLIVITLMSSSAIPIFASNNTDKDGICRNYHFETTLKFTEAKYYQNKQKLEKARTMAEKFQEYLVKTRKACAVSNEKLSSKIEELNNHEQTFVKSGLLKTSSLKNYNKI